MPALHPNTPPSLALFESRLVLPFCYRLTQVVPINKLLNGCSSVNNFTDFFLRQQTQRPLNAALAKYSVVLSVIVCTTF